MNALLQDSHVWVLISFLLFVGGFAKFGWGKLTAVLDAKITAIKSEIETAEVLRNEAQALLNDYRYKQHAAEEEAKQIIAQAHIHADQLKKQLEAELEDTAARREAQLAQRLKQMEDKAVADIRAYAADLAIKATTEIIARTVDDKIGARLADQAIERLAS